MMLFSWKDDLYRIQGSLLSQWYTELFYICDNLGIGIEIDDSDILTFNRIIEDKKKKSKSVEESYLWLWANSKSDEEKRNC